MVGLNMKTRRGIQRAEIDHPQPWLFPDSDEVLARRRRALLSSNFASGSNPVELIVSAMKPHLNTSESN